jgi:phosphohistidine phosphatase
MAAQLWILRHAEAEPHGARPDAERRLTERGEEQARAAGRALAALEVRFQAVFASPKVRARDTARLACEALGGEPVEHPPLAGGFDRGEALALVRPDERVLVVGHDPDLSQLVHDLTGARVGLRKGGLAGVRVDGGRTELLALLRPRELARMGGYADATALAAARAATSSGS